MTQRWQPPSDELPGPSAKARIAGRTVGLTMRPLASNLPPYGPGVWVGRTWIAGLMAAGGGVARGTRVERVDERTPGGARVVGEWVRARGADAFGPVVLYVHGSGFVICSTKTHRGLVSRLSERTGMPAFTSDYRLAPRHRFPKAADDVRAAWDHLLASGLTADQIVIAGDSAGGHLAVDLTLQLLREGAPTAAALALFSPLIDTSLTLASERDRQHRDPIISAAGARRLISRYTEGVDPQHPRLALQLKDAMGFPPVLIQAGGSEMFAADAEYLHRELTAAGAHSRLQIWPGQAHVFQALPRFSGEAEPALAQAADFLAAHVSSRQIAKVAG
ncbi:MAG TPA: alpha/beta hydrolase, partial [Sporichthya sp.]|nr:alpha/beta hydrolase [Sporichthya sp.]